MLKRCEFCQRIYTPIHSRQRYCKDECRIRAHYAALRKEETRTCAVCNVKFKTKMINRIYCSKMCHDIANNKKMSKTIKCKHCGKIFVATTYRKEYCSTECRDASKKLRDQGRAR